MPVFDQYEVEPMSAYSGSYAANYVVFITSSIGSDGQLINQKFSTNQRVVAIDKASGIRDYFNNVIWNYETYLNIIFNKGQPGRINRNLNYYSSETFLDSIVPDPTKIHEINGGKVSGFIDQPLLLLTYGENLTSSTDGQTVTDNLWHQNFPFQSTYKNVKKLFTPNKYTDNIKYALSANWGSTIPKAQAEWRANTIAPVKLNSDNFLIGWLVTSASYPYSQFTETTTVLSESRITNNNLMIHLGGRRRISPAITFPGSISQYVYDNDILDDYFGFGNVTSYKNVGFDLKFEYGATSTPLVTGSNNSSCYNYVYSNTVRGFKYGLYSANQFNTRCTFRLGRYGQNRDMLEGRATVASLIISQINPYTNEQIPRTLFYPLQISFMSGTTIYNQSKDYVTATNPSYNPYDSGIYDIYYRSGKPFFDRDNED